MAFTAQTPRRLPTASITFTAEATVLIIEF